MFLYEAGMFWGRLLFSFAHHLHRRLHLDFLVKISHTHNMRLLTRIFVFLLVVTFFVHIFSISAFAQETPSTMPFSLPQTEQGVPRDVHTLSQSVILGMLSFATCALSGIDLTYSDHR